MNPFTRLFRKRKSTTRSSTRNTIQKIVDVLLDTKADKDDRLMALTTLADVLFPGEALFLTSFTQPTEQEVDAALHQLRSQLRGRHLTLTTRSYDAAIAGIEWVIGRQFTVVVPSYLRRIFNANC